MLCTVASTAKPVPVSVRKSGVSVALVVADQRRVVPKDASHHGAWLQAQALGNGAAGGMNALV